MFNMFDIKNASFLRKIPLMTATNDDYTLACELNKSASRDPGLKIQNTTEF